MPALTPPNRPPAAAGAPPGKPASVGAFVVAARQYPIPHKSARALQAYAGKAPLNAGLIFSRFAPVVGPDDKEAKKIGLTAVCNAAARADRSLLAAWSQRWREGAVAFGATPFTAATDWRFVPGLGRKGSLEVGLTFHQYGFPYLPGSSVKGLARSWAALMEGLDERSTDFLAIFGQTPGPYNPNPKDRAEARAGGAVFLDAIPEQLPVLELDIMNPHYPKYYQGDQAPTDTQSPVPVYFLTVAPNTPYLFAVGWRGSHPEVDRLRALAQNWLQEALQNLGAGAKTSAGYGYFNLGGLVAPAPAAASAKGRPAAATMSASAEHRPPAAPRLRGQGRLKYEKGRAWVVDAADPLLRLWVDWTALGNPERPADKTAVTYEYIESDGRRTLVSLKKRQ